MPTGGGGGMGEAFDPLSDFAGAQGIFNRPQTTSGGTPITYGIGGQGGSPSFFGPGGAGFGMDFNDFSGIGNYATSFMLPSGNVMDPLGFVAPTETKEKEEQKDERSWREKRAAGENPFLERLKNIKDPAKRRAWAKRFFGNLLRFNPATRSMMMVYDLAKAIKEGGREGIMGALGQTAMQKIFGKNLDVASGIFGAASGEMTAGQALGGVAMGRGMEMGVNNLMKNIYKKWGLRGVQIAMPMIETILKGQGQGPGKG